MWDEAGSCEDQDAKAASCPPTPTDQLLLHFLRNPVPGEVVDKITHSLAFSLVNGLSRTISEGRSEAVVIGWGRQGFPRKELDWAEHHREGMTVPGVMPSVDLSTARDSQRRDSFAVGFVLDWRAGGGGLAVVRLSGTHVASSESHQMRLLLVKRGSALPLYLRLVTDHLRLFTIYEQVG